MDGNVAYRIFVAYQQEKWDVWHVFSEFEVIMKHIYMMPPVDQHSLSVLLGCARRPIML